MSKCMHNTTNIIFNYSIYIRITCAIILSIMRPWINEITFVFFIIKPREIPLQQKLDHRRCGCSRYRLAASEKPLSRRKSTVLFYDHVALRSGRYRFTCDKRRFIYREQRGIDQESNLAKVMGSMKMTSIRTFDADESHEYKA